MAQFINPPPGQSSSNRLIHAARSKIFGPERQRLDGVADGVGIV